MSFLQIWHLHTEILHSAHKSWRVSKCSMLNNWWLFAKEQRTTAFAFCFCFCFSLYLSRQPWLWLLFAWKLQKLLWIARACRGGGRTGFPFVSCLLETLCCFSIGRIDWWRTRPRQKAADQLPCCCITTRSRGWVWPFLDSGQQHWCIRLSRLLWYVYYIIRLLRVIINIIIMDRWVCSTLSTNSRISTTSWHWSHVKERWRNSNECGNWRKVSV